MRALRTLTILVLLAAFYVAVNPHYYGDSVWFAVDIKAGRGIQAHAVDLLWHPLGTSWAALFGRLTGVSDPLVAIQWLSALFMAACPLLLVRLARRFGFSPEQAALSGVLLGATHLSFAYGGSGSSVPAAVAFVIASLTPLVRRDGTSARSIALSVTSFAIASLFWAPALLLLPTLAITTLFWSGGSVGTRAQRALTVTVTALLLSIGAAWLLYSALPPTADGQGLFHEWFIEVARGLPAEDPLAVRIGRAFFAPANSLLFFESLGTSVKGLLLGDYSLVNVSQASQSITVAAIFLLFSLLVAVGAIRLIQTREYRRLLFMTVVSMTVYGFATVSWFDSDVERFSLALPLMTLSLIMTLAAFDDGTTFLRRFLPLTFAVFLLVANFVTFSLPALLSSGGLVGQLSEAAIASLPRRSLIVVTGQYLGGRTWAPVAYFTGMEVHSILLDVQSNGAPGWEGRLQESIDQALRENGRIAVLSDLLGLPTPGGVGLSPLQYPEPSAEQTRQFFAPWQRLGQWRAGNYLFIELEPPKSHG